MKVIPQWWRAHFLPVEFGLAFLTAGLFALWVECFDGKAMVDHTLNGNRSAVYGSVASIFGSLLGFAITAVSIVLGFSSSDRLAVVRESRHYPTLWKVFTAAIRALGAATIITLFGLVVDRDNSPVRWILHASVFASVLAALRLARCVWALEKVIGLITAPSKARPGDAM